MENNIKRKFTKEYKLQVVRLVKDEQRSPGELSKDLAIDPSQIYRWDSGLRKESGYIFTRGGETFREK
jgi:transposase-like protein